MAVGNQFLQTVQRCHNDAWCFALARQFKWKKIFLGIDDAAGFIFRLWQRRRLPINFFDLSAIFQLFYFAYSESETRKNKCGKLLLIAVAAEKRLTQFLCTYFTLEQIFREAIEIMVIFVVHCESEIKWKICEAKVYGVKFKPIGTIVSRPLCVLAQAK